MPVRLTYDKTTLEVMEWWDPDEVDEPPQAINKLTGEPEYPPEDYERVTLENIDPVDMITIVGTHQREPKPIILTPDLIGVATNPAFSRPFDGYELTRKIKEYLLRIVELETKAQEAKDILINHEQRLQALETP